MRTVSRAHRRAPMSASAVSLLLHSGAVLGLVLLSSPTVMPPHARSPIGERLVYVPPAAPAAARPRPALQPAPPTPARAPTMPTSPAMLPPELPAAAVTPMPSVPPSASLPIAGLAAMPGGGVAALTAGGTGEPTGTTGAADSPTVWEGEHVDQIVKVRRAGPAPRYPMSLQAIGMEAHLVARFIVDTTGRVRPGSIELVPTDTPLAFRQAVIAHLTATTYQPAMAGGRVVPQWVEQAFAFTLKR